MKALTLYQPWATLVALGLKRIETRSWPCGHVGPLAIHAAKTMPPYAREFALGPEVGAVLYGFGFRDTTGDTFRHRSWRLNPQTLRAAFPLGKVLATVEMTGCYEIVADADKACETRVAPFVAIDWTRGTGSTEGVVRLWRGGTVDTYGTPIKAWSGISDGIAADHESSFGDYTPGRWAWMLDGADLLERPVPATGRQGLWNWDPPTEGGNT